MAWFADLSAYEYLQRSEYTACVNVGWLDGERDFARGDVPRKFVARLRRFCRVRVHEGQAVYSCNLADCPGLAAGAQGDDAIAAELGSAEIRVFARDGTTYAAPDLILHYVCAHDYQPPAEFIAAVMRGPKPTSNKYARLLLAHTPDARWLYEESIERMGIGRLKEFLWRGYAAERERERDARMRVHRERAISRRVEAMLTRYGLGDELCSMHGCDEHTLGGKAFCVHHTPIDVDIVVAES